ncbi:MAG: DUF2971 domain-containing protein [Flavipsychrobacter sp.]|nr:DUF2971 domain-containing protein [Flavipsychrobacter sp.]
MKKSIFKFHCVNSYSLEALKNSQIFCNHYMAFNDPFECWCIEQNGIPDPVHDKERFSAVYRAWGFVDPDFSQGGVEQLNGYCDQFDNEYARNVSKYIESARISCFSRDINNMLMWSHYADGLRGFCIEFDPEMLIKSSSQAVILKVKYRRKPEYLDTMVYSVAEDQVDFHEMAINEELQYRKYIKKHKIKNIRTYADWLKKSRRLLFDLYAKQLAVKPIEWCYEKEMRLIFHSRSDSVSGEFFDYPATAVKSIVFGEKMSAETTKLLTNIVHIKYPDIPVGVAIRNRNDYKINIKF